MLLDTASRTWTARKALVWIGFPALWIVVLYGMAILGSSWEYIGWTALCLILWLASLYLLGGMKTMAGFTVFFLGFQHQGFAHFMKVAKLQEPSFPLYDPVRTQQAYALAFTGILAAALLVTSPAVRRLPRILEPENRIPQLKIMAILFTVLHVGYYLGVSRFRILLPFEFLTPIAVAASTAYAIRRSNGRRLFNVYTAINILIPMAAGIVQAQRREASLALAVLFVTAIAFRFRFRFSHLVLGAGLAFFFLLVVFPFALVARTIQDRGDFLERVEPAAELFTDAIANPEKYQSEAEELVPTEYYEFRHFNYYGEPNSLMERFSVHLTTDAIMRGADQVGYTGWTTIVWGLQMLPHRSMYEEKKYVGTSNWIARRAPGLLNERDVGTSITQGWIADAYSSFRWSGLLWIPFTITFLYLLMMRFVVDDKLGSNIFAVTTLAIYPWAFSEGPIQENIVMIFQTTPLFVATSLIVRIAANSMSPAWTLKKSIRKGYVQVVEP